MAANPEQIGQVMLEPPGKICLTAQGSFKEPAELGFAGFFFSRPFKDNGKFQFHQFASLQAQPVNRTIPRYNCPIPRWKPLARLSPPAHPPAPRPPAVDVVAPPARLTSLCPAIARRHKLPLCATSLPTGVVLTYRGPYAGMRAAYQWLYGRWLVGSDYTPADSPVFEEYLNSPRDTLSADFLSDIFLPLEPFTV